MVVIKNKHLDTFTKTGTFFLKQQSPIFLSFVKLQETIIVKTFDLSYIKWQLVYFF